MDKELKQQLEWMNANLNTIARDQAMIYTELKEIEKRMPKGETEG
jgi:chaperonin cofactor prefoldin